MQTTEYPCISDEAPKYRCCAELPGFLQPSWLPIATLSELGELPVVDSIECHELLATEWNPTTAEGGFPSSCPRPEVEPFGDAQPALPMTYISTSSEEFEHQLQALLDVRYEQNSEVERPEPTSPTPQPSHPDVMGASISDIAEFLRFDPFTSLKMSNCGRHSPVVCDPDISEVSRTDSRFAQPWGRILSAMERVSERRQNSRECPQRSVSAPDGPTKTVSQEQSTSSVNAVALFYAATTQNIVMMSETRSVMQLTNTQTICQRISSIKTTSSIQSQTQNRSPVRSLSARSIQALIAHLPFADLLTTDSLDNDAFRQSVQQYYSICRDLDTRSRPRHRFKEGKLSASGTSSVMRQAYPTVRCGRCAKVFQGQDRKRKLVCHRRKVHGSGSVGTRKGISSAPKDANASEGPNTSAGRCAPKGSNTPEVSSAPEVLGACLTDPRILSTWPSLTCNSPNAASPPSRTNQPAGASQALQTRCKRCNLEFSCQCIDWEAVPLRNQPAPWPLGPDLEYPPWPPGQAQRYPPLVCHRCGKIFTGKYASGNRMRHLGHAHKPMLDKALETCRRGLRKYNRIDALRRNG